MRVLLSAPARTQASEPEDVAAAAAALATARDPQAPTPCPLVAVVAGGKAAPEQERGVLRERLASHL